MIFKMSHVMSVIGGNVIYHLDYGCIGQAHFTVGDTQDTQFCFLFFKKKEKSD